jgi:hypothetical protein
MLCAKRHPVEIVSVSVWDLEALMYLLSDTIVCFLQSLFSVGATGTIVFGLASKDLASQLISGLTLHLSEKMFEVRSTACTEILLVDADCPIMFYAILHRVMKFDFQMVRPEK